MKRLLFVGLLALVLSAVAAAPAFGAFGFKELEVSFEEEDGSAATLAGSHPFQMTTTVAVNTSTTAAGEVPEGELRDLTAAQIPGFVGSQTAVPTCDAADFNNRIEGRPSCPDSTAVGYAGVTAEFEVLAPSEVGQMFHMPVYNLTPPPGVPARLGFVVLNVPITIDITVSESPPYNLIAKVTNTPQALLFYSSKLTIWGNPASPAHDSLRGNCVGEVDESSLEPISLGECPAGIEEEAFLTLPRACEGALSSAFSILSWAGESAAQDAPFAGATGCDELDFSPEATAQPTSNQAESPTGLAFDIEVEDEGLTDPEERADSDLKEVRVTLPEGMTINPSAGEGLAACSLAQYEAASLQNPGCPEAAKIGTAEVSSPLLADPLDGTLYVAEQDNNPFKSTFALYLIIRDEKYGISIKQAGKVEADPQTGRLTSSFQEVPQLPFSHLSVRFRGGSRAPLVTPSSCGTYTTETLLTSWADPDAPLSGSSSFEVSSGVGGGACPSASPSFAPAFTAGSTNSEAGAYSPFYMRITRSDGEQQLTRLDSVLPPGLLGKIAGVERCSDEAIAAAEGKDGRAELAQASCPQGSRLGRIQAGAGVGSELTWVSGTIYLAGPFDGDPLSIVVVTPAVAGPFDLGTVVIREGLRLNPNTADAEVDGSASPIPQILEGVPLRLRELRVYVDRPEFTLNPTNCNPLSASATTFGSLGAVATASAHYQAANCGRLRFKPKLSLKLKGGTKRNDHAALRSTLRPRSGDANIGRAVVTLPRSQQIDNAHINNPCTRVQFNAESCPEGSVLGTAKAYSPLLDQPLEGKVYFRSNGGERTLPDIVADLRGQFRFILVGFVDTATPKTNPRIRTTFADVPDAPVTKFELNLYGGERGLLVNNRNLCKSKQRAKLRFTGQNGRKMNSQPLVATSCKKKGKRDKK